MKKKIVEFVIHLLAKLGFYRCAVKIGRKHLPNQGEGYAIVVKPDLKKLEKIMAENLAEIAQKNLLS